MRTTGPPNAHNCASHAANTLANDGNNAMRPANQANQGHTLALHAATS